MTTADSPTAAVLLVQEKDKLRAAILPLIAVYEKATGLAIDSISLKRMYPIASRSEIVDINVRTNADSL